MQVGAARVESRPDVDRSPSRASESVAELSVARPAICRAIVRIRHTAHPMISVVIDGRNLRLRYSTGRATALQLRPKPFFALHSVVETAVGADSGKIKTASNRLSIVCYRQLTGRDCVPAGLPEIC